jgi:hypothetical protein
MTQPQNSIDARDLLDAMARQRNEASDALAAANAMIAKILRETEALRAEVAALQARAAEVEVRAESD